MTLRAYGPCYQALDYHTEQMIVVLFLACVPERDRTDWNVDLGHYAWIIYTRYLGLWLDERYFDVTMRGYHGLRTIILAGGSFWTE